MNEVASPSKIMSPVSSYKKVTSEYSFFWDPEADEKNEVASKSASPVKKLSASVLIPIVMCKIPLGFVQSVSLVHPFVPKQIIISQITSAPIQCVSTLQAISPIPIVMTSIAKPPMDLIYCTFTPDKILTSLHSSPSGLKRNHPFPVHKTKVSSSSKKAQFSGSCKIKSRHLLCHKVHFIGSSWNRMRNKKSSRQFISRVLKALHYGKDSSQKRTSSLKICKKCICRSSQKSAR